MIGHIERIIEHLLSLIGGWMFGLAITLVLGLAAAAFMSLSLYKFDRESCLFALRRTARTLSRGWGWILAGMALLLQVYALTELRGGLMERLSEQDQARYISKQDPGGSPTTQRAPQVAFLETSTRTQRIVLPPQLTSLEAVPGWSPEQARYGERPAVNVQDELVKDEKAVVLNRTTSVLRYVPMKLLSSDVDLKLSFKQGVSSQSGQVYKADFTGKYAIHNPFPEARRIHFSFPLPDNSGTLNAFHFKVNSVDIPAQDVNRGLDWEGELQPKAQAQIEIGYSHLGARAWTYDVTGRREPIADFHLAVHSDKGDVKFLRGSLYPSRITAQSLDWNLQNQITSQNISLFFPSISVEQLVGNLYVFAPLGLMMLATLVIVWGRLRRTGTTAWQASLACLACCGGYTLASYLIGYLPLALSLVIAFAVTALLQFQILGRALWLPVALTVLAPLTFLAAGDTGLLLTSLSLVGLALTIHETVRRAVTPPELEKAPPARAPEWSLAAV